MINILVCVNEGLIKLRIKRILSEKNLSYSVTEKPIRRADLIRYDIIIIHYSYHINDLYNFVENALLHTNSIIIFITNNTKSNLLRKLEKHANIVFIDENKMDVELPLSILIFNKQNTQIKKLTEKNIKLLITLKEKNLMGSCKRKLMKIGYSEDKAHKYILKYAMDNHINKIEACNRLLLDNNE